MATSPSMTTCIVVRHTGLGVDWVEGRDVWYHDEMAADDITTDCALRGDGRRRSALHPLHLRLHRASPRVSCTPPGATLLYASYDPRADLRLPSRGQVYWCTADIGWVTGHTYIVYGPLPTAPPAVMFEGVPSYPAPDRFWAVVEKYKVNIFYTAPTALRAIAREGDEWVKKHDLFLPAASWAPWASPSTRKCGSGTTTSSASGRCPIVDTWWQTETGGILITPLPGSHEDQAGFGHAAVLRSGAGAHRCRRRRDRRARGGQPLHPPALARP